MKGFKIIKPFLTAGFLLFMFGQAALAWADPLTETREIKFTGEGIELAQKASELGNAAAIYEFVRNTHEFALYHGSRSNTINTYGGQRGSDVDVASVLVAMYRSQGIPARYAVGTIRVPAIDVANWLAVHDIDLATAVLKDQGIQNVVLSTDRQYIQFEHIWVQAQIPFENYRGVFNNGVNCMTTPARCNWIDLDPSFKLRQFHNQGIDIYGVVNFNYDLYYNAIKNNDPAYRDKGPAEIYQEQILAYLKTNYPGKTLEDVADPGIIIPVNHGLLPASLPYEVLGAVTTHDAIVDHDAVVGNKKWAKFLNGSFTIQAVFTGGGTLTITTGIGGPHALADLSTKRLTVTYSPTSVNGVSDRVEVRLDGTLIATPFTSSGSLTFPVGTPFTLNATLDGAPSIQTGTPDTTINVTYNNLIVGGYYLIGTGGDTSNWSQVHRAAAQLLEANQTYKIVLNPAEAGCIVTSGIGCTPYVDNNLSTVYDAGDTRLLDTPNAQDALTGGLLYVAMSQYYTKFVENVRRLDALNHVISPIEGFVGIVSSTYEVEYLGETAFSVMPGGLLIDMKGVQFNGTWRNNAPDTYANDHFLMIGHEGSSLEHEIWQEITGFDAVSTVRGIQMALASGQTLQKPANTGTGNNMASQYVGFQFSDGTPASGFTYVPFTVFGTQPATWTHATNGAQMELLKRDVTAANTANQRALATYNYSSSSGLYAWANCVNSFEDQLLTFPPAAIINPFTFCDGTVYSGAVSTILSQMQTRYLTIIIPTYIGQTYFDFFDRAKGFDPAAHVYRSVPLAVDQHGGSRIQGIRDDVMIGSRVLVDGANARFDYVIPGRKTQGDLYRFSVFLEKITSSITGNIASQSYSISNDFFVAGGGWVDGATALEAATSLPGITVIQPTFNNEVFTDIVLVAQTNNDLIRTPSTSDPVSTVTGNMYHDETDVTIKGRDLNIAFTRSYNSGPPRVNQDGPLGFGWTHSYNMSLRSNDFGKCPNCAPGSATGQAPENGNNITASITYIDERGGEHTYLVNESTLAITQPKGDFDTLTLDSPSSGFYTLTFRNGTKYVFSGPATLKTSPNQTARLTYIEDAYGNRLTMNYDGSNRLSSITDNLAIAGRSGLTLTYSGSSTRIQTLQDWSGRTWTYGYDASGNLASITNPLSQTLTYTYHAGTHLLNELILPASRGGQQVKTAFAYYQNNKAFNYQNTLGHTETLDYDLFRQRTQVTDPRGFIRTHFYDTANGALIKLEEPDGAILRFENNADGLRYSKTDGLNYQTQYSYAADRSIGTAASNNFGRVSREIDPLNQTMDYNYGLYDQPTLTTDKRGNPLTQTYYASTNVATDAVAGRLQEVRATLNGTPNVLLASFTYYASGAAFGQLKQQMEYVDPANAARQRITNYVYEANGINVQSVSVSGGTSGGTITHTYTYDTLARVRTDTLARRTSATNAALINLTTTYDYDALGRVTRVTTPRGDRQETVYDANGKVTAEKVHYLTATARPNCAAPSGGYVVCTIASHSYDAADRRISTIDILGNATTFTYDAMGNVIATTDANGHTMRAEYDGMNRRTAMIDANGHRSEMTYDLGGRLTSTRDANGNVTRFDYDALGRQTKVITPLTFEVQTQYDANGNVTHVTDPNAVAGLQPRNNQSASVYRQYDEFNRLTLERDAINGDTTYTYDLFGNITSITDALNQVTTFVYDDLGRLIETRDPILNTPTDKTDQVTLYDEAGNVLQTQDRSGKQRRFTYDNLNRLITTDYLQDSRQESYTYDGFGDLTQVSNGDTTYTYTYTARHEMASKNDSGIHSMAWTYDPVGNLASKTDYQGAVTEYQFDATNRLVAEKNSTYVQVSYHYDGAGRLLNRILSNGAQTDYQFDNGNRLTGLKNIAADGTVVENLTYLRDRLGNITQIFNSVGGKTIDYTYDALYRLTNVNSSDNTEDRSYTYDAVGNRKTEVANGTTYYYCYHATNCSATPSGNRLINLRTGSPTGALYRQFTYDDSGRVLQKLDGSGTPIYTLTYNGKGRANTVNGITMLYDTYDHRAAKGSLGYFLEGEHVESVYDGPTLQKKYFRGSVVDEIVNAYFYHSAGNNDWTNYTFHHDQLNSVTALTGPAGEVQETNRFDAFGQPLNLVTPGTGNSLLYTGREYDSESGLYYYRARYYDPEIGRFIAEDPKGFAAGINFYAYVNNNPVNANDPSGEVIETVWDVANVGIGIYSLQDNVRNGNWGWAAVDALGLVYDGVATAVPFLPAGASAGLQAYRAGNTIVNSAQIGLDVANTARVADNAASSSRAVINTNLDAAREGTRIHNEVGNALDAGNILSDSANNFFRGSNGALGRQPDLSWNGSGMWADLTTQGQWGRHVNDYTNTGFGTGIPLIYEAGRGITNMTSLPTFMGTTTTVGQYLFDSGNQSAGGGFVLYPSRPNTNMNQSVYRK